MREPEPFLIETCETAPRPLRVLITRPADQAEESAEQVRAAGGIPLVYPCLRPAPPRDPRPLDEALARLDRFCALALTSANAVEAVAPALRGASPPLPLIAVVGERTADALRRRGLTADLVGDSDGGALAARLLAALRSRELPRPHRVLLPGAQEARDELRAALEAAGAEPVPVIAYRMIAASADELRGLVEAVAGGAADLLPFGSPRTVAVALGALGPDAARELRRLRVGAIGQTTAAALREAGVRVDAVAPQPSFHALLRALAACPRPVL